MVKALKEEKSSVKGSREDKIFDIVTYVLLGLLLIIIAYPLYFVVIASISDPYAVTSGKVILWPVGVNFRGYSKILQRSDIWIGYFNTFAYTIVGTLINVIFTMAVSYPLSRKYFSGRKVLMIYFMITMYFGGGMIPEFLLIKGLHMRNTFAVMVVLGAVGVFNMIICKSFLEANIPAELEEAASIDGCSSFRFFIQFVFPLSGSIIAVLVLYYGIEHWNDYMRALIYIDDANKYPLQLILRSILIQTELEVSDSALRETMEEKLKLAESIKYGVIIVASLPVLIIYPFLQKYFAKGVMIGSLKG